MKPTHTPLLILSCAVFCTPTVMAANKEPIKPHLIKISSAHKSSHGINIIKGKIKTPNNQTERQTPTIQTQKAKIISNQSCLNEDNPEKNKNLADSLKRYLSTKNQDPSIIDDILYASEKTNVNFELLIVKAMIESDLGRRTKAKHSSARGVFQYIDTTWLTLLDRHGEQIKDEMDNKNDLSEEELLNLRYNPRIAALIKAHQTKDDETAIKSMKNHGIITATDHYIAHMLGIPLATKFYELIEKESNVILANSHDPFFKRAAKLNPAFFTDHKGTALNAFDSYQKFHDKISARYDKIRDIQEKYGLPPLTRSECTLPTVKTAGL